LTERERDRETEAERDTNSPAWHMPLARGGAHVTEPADAAGAKQFVELGIQARVPETG